MGKCGYNSWTRANVAISDYNVVKIHPSCFLVPARLDSAVMKLLLAEGSFRSAENLSTAL